MQEPILLHSCCAPCSAAVLEWLLLNDFEPVIFFYNPNIFPKDEYDKRKMELVGHARALGVRMIDGDWDHARWLEFVRGLENEPERGARCQKCFDLRLTAAAAQCQRLGIARFTTTLASSRWKSLEQVSQAGLAAAARFEGVTYWDRNWRKGGLQDRRNALLKIHAFYNQQWCGCEFSRRDMLLRAKAREQNP